MARQIIYTGTVDSYFEYCFGPLEYRSLRFETEVLDIPNYQGVAVMNFTGLEPAYTRIIEHKHFEFGTQPKTVVTREYPLEWSLGIDPYYPINNEQNQQRYAMYASLAKKEPGVVFGGRLGEYKYYDMQDTIISALACTKQKL
jgi:UDP-galactopyranose mutase